MKKTQGGKLKCHTAVFQVAYKCWESDRLLPFHHLLTDQQLKRQSNMKNPEGHQDKFQG